MRFHSFFLSPRLLLGGSTLFSLGIASLVGFLWFGSTALIQPSRRPLEASHEAVLDQPREFGLALEEHTVLATGNAELQTILVSPAASPGKATKTRRMISRLQSKGIVSRGEPRGTIVLLHGRGGLKENMLWIAQRFVAAEFRCIVYDARAHGQSEGRFCSFGKHEVKDLETILCSYRDLLSARGEAIGPVGAFGNSLGAAVVLQSLDQFSPETPPIQAAVAVAPFASLPEVAVMAGKKKIHPHLPRSIIHASMRLGGWRAGFDPFSISPLESSTRSTTPLFLAHGRLDGVIPIHHSHQIRENSTAEPLFWHEIPDGYHSNVLAKGGDDLYEKMVLFYLEFLESGRI